MKTKSGLLIAAVFLLISACIPNAVPGPGGSTASPPPPPGTGMEGTAMSDESMPQDPAAQRMVQLAKESLARKFKISVDQIFLSSVDAMNWPDASLGCPQPGILYAQVMTPGFQIMLEAIGQAFTYHTDTTERVILCDVRPPDEIFLPP